MLKAYLQKYHSTYLQKYRSKGVLIDTNLLLLLFVGKLSKSFIKKFKRTDKYTIEDYQILLRFVDEFDKLITTPNIMTEVSNLGGNMHGDMLKGFFSVFANSFTVISEKYLPSKSIANNKNFDKFGLTDIGIMLVAKDNYLILTDDFKLSQFASKNDIDTINFNHIKYNYSFLLTAKLVR